MPMLFSSTDRGAAHAKLAEILALGDHPRAECREDANADEPYQVWDAPRAYVAPPPPDPTAVVDVVTHDDVLDALADRLMAKLAERGV